MNLVIAVHDVLTVEEYRAIEQFMQQMVKRLEDGRGKYGMDYLVKDNLLEATFELFDLANYALLESMKLDAMRREKK